MDFGMPSLIEINSLEECASLCQKLGLKFIELNMNFPEYQLDKLDIDHLNKIANKYGIYYTIHLDENLNPCDFNSKVASAYTQTVLDAIAVAKQINAPILNMHLVDGVYLTLPKKRIFLFDAYEDVYLQNLRHFCDSCIKAVGNTEIKICIENTAGFNRASFMKNALSLLLESSIFSLTLDIGHDAAIGFTDKSLMLGYENKLSHMHVHDAKGTKNHLSLGSGELDLSQYLELAKMNNCRVVLETKTIAALKDSAGWLHTKQYKI